MGGSIRVGLSGWRYAGWRGGFYPAKLRQADELRFASRAVSTIEINGSFYSLQTLASYRQWYDDTPDDFVFSIKGPRYLTHTLRFREERIMVASADFFASGLLALGKKMGPILWQFPPNYRFDAAAFEAFLRLLPPDTERLIEHARLHDHNVKTPLLVSDRKRRVRHAVEVRHASFCDPAYIRLLRRYGVAVVVSDAVADWPVIQDVTADFVYLRLHGAEALYSGSYSEEAIERWAARIEAWAGGGQPHDAVCVLQRPPKPRAARDVYCFFDNDNKVHAPFDARRLLARLGLAQDLAPLPPRAARDGPPGPA